MVTSKTMIVPTEKLAAPSGYFLPYGCKHVSPLPVLQHIYAVWKTNQVSNLYKVWDKTSVLYLLF